LVKASDNTCNTPSNTCLNSLADRCRGIEARAYHIIDASEVELKPCEIARIIHSPRKPTHGQYTTVRGVCAKLLQKGLVLQPYPGAYCNKITYKLTPKKNKDWELTGFKYIGIKEGYDVDEVLYFVNTQLENDFLGLSDVEPIRSTCKARNYLLDKDFPEITRRLWAPYILLEADIADMADDDVTAFLKDLAKIAEAGKSTAINKSVTVQVVEFRINLGGLCS
jgi:hypothetical protein